MLENHIVIDDDIYIENDEYENYLEHLAEEDDREYEDEIFERLSEE
jgi:hypothetical protein